VNILLIEDDDEIATFVRKGLQEQQYVVEHAASAEQGILSASSGTYDVIIFDRLLPGMDGIDAVRVLRQSKVQTPIIMLTAMSGIDDRVAGLEAGADDYLVKPFAFSELLARVRALGRRKPIINETIEISIGGLILNRATRRVTRDAQEIDLLPREYKILEYMIMNPNHVITRTMLLERIWGYSFDPKTSLVQTHVSRMRAKVDKPFDKELIKTVRGAGYVFSAP